MSTFLPAPGLGSIPGSDPQDDTVSVAMSVQCVGMECDRLHMHTVLTVDNSLSGGNLGATSVVIALHMSI